MYHTIRSFYFWSGMKREIVKYVGKSKSKWRSYLDWCSSFLFHYGNGKMLPWILCTSSLVLGTDMMEFGWLSTDSRSQRILFQSGKSFRWIDSLSYSYRRSWSIMVFQWVLSLITILDSPLSSGLFSRRRWVRDCCTARLIIHRRTVGQRELFWSWRICWNPQCYSWRLMASLFGFDGVRL